MLLWKQKGAGTSTEAACLKFDFFFTKFACTVRKVPVQRISGRTVTTSTAGQSGESTEDDEVTGVRRHIGLSQRYRNTGMRLTERSSWFQRQREAYRLERLIDQSFVMRMMEMHE